MDNSEIFDRLLLQTIDEIVRYCLGEINTKLIYNHLEKKGCSPQEIPKKLDIFTREIESLIGVGKGQILGAVKILENSVVKTLCTKLEISLSENSTGYFPNQIRNLKEIYTRQVIHPKLI